MVRRSVMEEEELELLFQIHISLFGGHILTQRANDKADIDYYEKRCWKRALSERSAAANS